MTKTKMEAITTEELEAELKARRAEEARLFEEAKAWRFTQLSVLARDPNVQRFVLLTVGDHSRTSCVAGGSVNIGRCPRCTVTDHMDADSLAELDLRLMIC